MDERGVGGLQHVPAEAQGGEAPGAAGVDEHALARLLREIFSAAGGTHDDWDEFDATMKRERRTAVFVAPEAGASQLS